MTGTWAQKVSRGASYQSALPLILLVALIPIRLSTNRSEPHERYPIGFLQLRSNAAENQCRVNERKEVPHASRANPRIGHSVRNLHDGPAGCGGRPAGHARTGGKILRVLRGRRPNGLDESDGSQSG